jgi:phospholipid/cholesterol/gamma-HCH transport system permease protein
MNTGGTPYQRFRNLVNEQLDAAFASIVGGIGHFVFEVGTVYKFMLKSTRLFFSQPWRWKELFQHMEFIGNRSVIIILLTGLFTGMALTFQVYLGFKIVNVTSLVGPTVAMGITRELGPVLTGLIVAARAGGAMAARLGTMRVTEQIDALDVMAVNSFQYLVSPRIIAAFLILPILNGVFITIAMIGSYMLSAGVLGLDEAVFIDKTAFWLNPNHLNEGMIKSCIFGFTFAVLCCYEGFYAKGGAKGVGEATNRGVVRSMVLIIILDFFLMNFIDLYYRFTK